MNLKISLRVRWVKPTLERIVQDVQDLPALPQIVEQVIRVTEDPDSTVKELNDIICQDQALTARILRLANSAYYGFPRRISTVVEAIVILGFNTIRNLVLAASVYDLLSREVPGYQLGKGELWRHSIACAMAARLLARQVRFPAPDQAFVAGLLHDIGKIVLSVYMQDAYLEIINTVKEKRIPFSQAEKDVLGFTHAEVGAKVAEKWNFPVPLVEAIAFHHEPTRARENARLTALVHIADAICMMMGIGLGGDGLCYPVFPEALSLLGLQQGIIEELIDRLSDLFVDKNSFLDATK
ncbi:MAG: Metal dependent phosphohydrolase [Thermoanaerobacterales bacterium 50_218]|nr:MAG: Metal dependent phosphohydrolase [Thermoanaerobacterales bacterium 50_218]